MERTKRTNYDKAVEALKKYSGREVIDDRDGIEIGGDCVRLSDLVEAMRALHNAMRDFDHDDYVEILKEMEVEYKDYCDRRSKCMTNQSSNFVRNREDDRNV